MGYYGRSFSATVTTQYPSNIDIPTLLLVCIYFTHHQQSSVRQASDDKATPFGFFYDTGQMLFIHFHSEQSQLVLFLTRILHLYCSLDAVTSPSLFFLGLDVGVR